MRLSAVVPVFAGPDIYLLVSGLFRPSQMIEFVFAASPETTRSEPQEMPSLSRQAAGPGSLRRRGSLPFSLAVSGLRYCGTEVFYRLERPSLAIDSE